MDPDSNLAEQLRIVGMVNTIHDAEDDLTPAQLKLLAAHAFRLAELVEALDQWISRHGFLPWPWRVTDCKTCGVRVTKRPGCTFDGHQQGDLCHVCDTQIVHIGWRTGAPPVS